MVSQQLKLSAIKINMPYVFGLKINKFFILSALAFVIAFFLRFHNLSSNPPGLYWDEAAFGYDAYSILKTGRDQHGVFLPTFFESFGDWKLPVYFYLLVPFISIFGLSELAIRFPSFLFGISTIICFYWLVSYQTKNNKLAVFCALILSFSPWHIQFSRAGFESTIALFFMLCGLTFLLKGSENKKGIYLILSFVLFALTMYTYHAYRIFTPIFLVGFLIVFFNEIKTIKIKLVIPVLVFILISIPLLLFTLTPNGINRAESETAFKINDLQKEKLYFDQRSKPPFRFLSSKIFTEPLFYSQVFLKNYSDHFSPVFLFLKGDPIGRHSLVDLGQLHIFEMVLIVLAIFNLKKINRRLLKVMFLWLVLAPISAAIVLPTPHANRALQMIIPLSFLSGTGAYYLYLSRRKLLKGIFLLWAILIVIIYAHNLFVYYPKKFGADWQDGYKQMVKTLQLLQDDYDTVYVTNINNVPYVYLLIYLKYDPAQYQTNGSSNGFGKYSFVPPDAPIYGKKRALYVAPPWQKIDGKAKAEVKDINNKTVYKIWEIGN